MARRKGRIIRRGNTVYLSEQLEVRRSRYGLDVFVVFPGREFLLTEEDGALYDAIRLLYNIGVTEKPQRR